MLPDALERFGIRTLGELAKLPRAALADRFGAARPAGARPRPGPRHAARRRARRPSGWRSAWSCRSRPRASQLQRGLELLDRPPAGPPRAARAHAARRRALRHAGGGRHLARARDVPRAAGRRRAACGSCWARSWPSCPSPTDVLRLRAEGFGPPAGDQRSLLAEPAAIRRARLREAVRQARSVAGPGRRAAHHPRRPRLAGARAAPDAGAMGSVRRPRRRRARCGCGSDGGRAPGGGRRAGGGGGARVLARRGPLVDATRRCAAATGRWSPRTGATSSCTATSRRGVVRAAVSASPLGGVDRAPITARRARIGPPTSALTSAPATAPSPRTPATAASAPPPPASPPAAATGRCPATRRGSRSARIAMYSTVHGPNPGSASSAARVGGEVERRVERAGRRRPPARARAAPARATAGMPGSVAVGDRLGRREAPSVAERRDELLRRPARARHADLLAEDGAHGELPSAPRAGHADPGRAREERIAPAAPPDRGPCRTRARRPPGRPARSPRSRRRPARHAIAPRR